MSESQHQPSISPTPSSAPTTPPHRTRRSNAPCSDDSDVWYTPPQVYNAAPQNMPIDDDIEIQEVPITPSLPRTATSNPRARRAPQRQPSDVVVISLSDDDDNNNHNGGGGGIENIVSNGHTQSRSVMVVSQPPESQPRRKQRNGHAHGRDQGTANERRRPPRQQLQRRRAPNAEAQAEVIVIAVSDDDTEDNVTDRADSGDHDKTGENIEGEDFYNNVEQDDDDEDCDDYADDDSFIDDDEPDFGDDVEEEAEEEEEEEEDAQREVDLLQGMYTGEDCYWQELKLEEKRGLCKKLTMLSVDRYNNYVRQAKEAEDKNDFVAAEWCLTQGVQLYDGDEKVILRLIGLAMHNGTISLSDF